MKPKAHNIGYMKKKKKTITKYPHNAQIHVGHVNALVNKRLGGILFNLVNQNHRHRRRRRGGGGGETKKSGKSSGKFGQKQ